MNRPCSALARDYTPSEELERFEGRIIDLAAALVRVVADDIDSEIAVCLSRIVTSLAIDRSTITEIDVRPVSPALLTVARVPHIRD
jgi:hypothetical protein